MRVLLTFIHPEQGDLFAVILLIREAATQLRQVRHPGLRPEVPAVGRTLLIIRQVRGVLPARQAVIAVDAQLEEVTPVFNTGPHTRVLPGQVVVPENVPAKHIAGHKVTQAGTKVRLGPPVGPVQAALREYQVITLVIQGHQQVELRVFQGKVLIRIQLHAGGTEVAQPLLKAPPGLAGDRAAGHGCCGITFCATSQEAPGL
ncbi:Uncharacterised protein [Klebsiella pneumoniae]|nr:Uncharacterised protein [Klebsiella pneumoniae]